MNGYDLSRPSQSLDILDSSSYINPSTKCDHEMTWKSEAFISAWATNSWSVQQTHIKTLPVKYSDKNQ